MKEMTIGVITVITSIASIPILMDGTLAIILLPVGATMIVDALRGGKMWEEVNR